MNSEQIPENAAYGSMSVDDLIFEGETNVGNFRYGSEHYKCFLDRD